MNIYQYTAWNNRKGSESLVSSYGMTPIGHPDELAKQLATLVTQDEQALQKIIAIHPDSQLFGNSGFMLPDAKKDTSNACGCSNFSNMDGQSIKREVEQGMAQKSEKTELFIIGGIIITLALILKK